MQLVDGIVSLFKRSLVLLDDIIEIQYVKTRNEEDIFIFLEEMEIKKEDIITMDLAYQVKKMEHWMELHPIWFIRLKGNELTHIDSCEPIKTSTTSLR